jgi:CheY-like chemotaxis protein/DNA-binding XRE family transcriptional regulator
VKNNGVKSDLGSVIREWRNRIGISQEELAERSGLHRTYVSDIERGMRNVSLENISKLSIALETSIGSLFSHIESGARDTPPPGGPPGDLVDILYVEDSPDDVALTTHALRRVMFPNRMQIARDGAEALDYLFCRGAHARRQPARLPHLILLDLHLPKVSGLEVLRQIKANPQTRSILVVVLTASRDKSEILASKQMGADACIVKPVELTNLSQVTPQLNLQWALLKAPAAGGG